MSDADERAAYDRSACCGRVAWECDCEPEAPEPLCEWCGRWSTDAVVCRACLLTAPTDAGEAA